MPTVVHKYPIKCDSHSHHPGLADFIRGTLVLYQKARKYGYTLEIDYSHPILQYLKGSNTSIKTSGHVIELILPISFDQQDLILNRLFQSGQNFNVFTHILPRNFYNEPVDLETRLFLQNFLTPNDEIVKEVNDIRSEIGNDFDVIHIRTGDYYMLNNTSLNNDFFYNKARETIKKIKNSIVIVTDNDILKRRLALLNNDHAPQTIHFTSTNPVHSGYLSTDAALSDRLKGTLLDFHLMSFAKNMYRISPEGSGFGYICSVIYDIPFVHVD